MSVKVIDGSMLALMFIKGGANLTKNAEIVDALNVFPVPDGDTGTNMKLSITSGVKEVKQKTTVSVSEVAASFSKGLLMGARGNSGVILSQLFRGFSKAIEQKKTINGRELAIAFEQGVKMAYKAVMKPVEGTILTVAKDAAAAASKMAKKESDALAVMIEVVTEAKKSLQRTPDLLPVLKQVGVVDSGGQGLVYIYEGFLAALKGEEVSGATDTLPMEDLIRVEHHHNAQSFLSTEDIEFGYCTEVMVKFERTKLEKAPFNEAEFRNELNQHGDSLLVVSDEDLLKIHIHAEEPGEVITKAQLYGSLINVKIENMREQHSHLLENNNNPPIENSIPEEKQAFGIVAVAFGEGISDLFKSMGATQIIEGGQTMNPSTEDIVKAIQDTNAESVFILPNNPNIIMAAEQAASVSEAEVTVIPSRTVPEGLAALLSFNPTGNNQSNRNTMVNAMKAVKTGQVTYAVRDTNLNDKEIKQGDFIGIFEKDIVSAGTSLSIVTKSLLDEIIDIDSEIVTIIWGEDVSDEFVGTIVEYVEEHYPDIDVEVHEGKQPLYSFIVSVE